MKIICAWCGEDIGEKESEGVDGVSHGVCNRCFARLQAEAEGGIESESEPGEQRSCMFLHVDFRL